MTSRGPPATSNWKASGDKFRAAHVHFEIELEGAALQQAQVLHAGAGAHAHHTRGVAVANQERGGTARAIARHLGDAAIGIVELNRAFGIGVARRIHQHPPIRADAGVAVADGSRNGGVIAGGRVGSVLTPGKEKIVLGAVRLGEGDLHFGMGTTSTAVP